jgi:flagellar hook-length control protein FliK
MTKGVSISTTTPKGRDSVISPAAPAPKPGDDGEVNSFATLLDTAAPTKNDEPESDNQSERTKPATERGQSHNHDSEATYFAPADLALAWLASRDVTPRSAKEPARAEESRGTTETPASASRATDSPDALGAADKALSRADADEQVPSASLGPGTQPGTPVDATGSGLESSSGSSATSSERRAPIEIGGGSSDPLLTSKTRPADVQDATDATQSATSAVSPPTDSVAHPSSRRPATLSAGDAAPQPASQSSGSDPSRDREPPAISETDRGSDARSISPASTTAVPAMPSPELQSRSAAIAGRAGAATEPNAPGEATNGAFTTANADGSYHVTAILNPPSLGRVDATIKVTGESVEVAITPHTAEGHDALSHHLDELRRELSSEHSEVHLSLADSGNQARHGDDPKHEPIATHPNDEDNDHVDTHAPAADSSLHIIL